MSNIEKLINIIDSVKTNKTYKDLFKRFYENKNKWLDEISSIDLKYKEGK